MFVKGANNVLEQRVGFVADVLFLVLLAHDFEQSVPASHRDRS